MAAAVVLIAVAASAWPANSQPAAARPEPAVMDVPLPLVATTVSVTAEPPTAAPAVTETAAVTEDAGLLSFASARLEDRHVERAPEPVALHIEALSVEAPVFGAGGSPDTGEMDVPETIHDVAWYKFGPSPGQPGSAVLAAHVDLAGQGPGVFFDLRALVEGDQVVVDFSDGSSRAFEVVDGFTYSKQELDTQRIFARSGPPVLTLITCGGAFNPSLGRYDSNVVVYATPADTAVSGTP